MIPLEKALQLVDEALRAVSAPCEKIRTRLGNGRTLADPVSGEVLAQLPVLEAVRRARDGVDWLFEIDPDEPPRPLVGEGAWRLELLDLARLEAFAVDAESERDGMGRRLRVRRAALWEDRVLERGGGPIAWSLAFRVGPVTLARSEGRITE